MVLNMIFKTMLALLTAFSGLERSTDKRRNKYGHGDVSSGEQTNDTVSGK